MSGKPILTLETLEPERPWLTIDGASYDLALMSDFGLVEQARLSRLMADAEAVRAEVAADTTERPFAAVSEDQALRTSALLRRILTLIVRDLPDEVEARLTDAKRMAIIQAFTGTLPPSGTATPTPTPLGPRSTSGNSRRRSPRSTVPLNG